MLAGLLFNNIEQRLLPAVSFDARRCLRSRLGSSTCAQCLSLCMNKALTLQNGKIVFQAEHCTECMTCISACPNDALICGFGLPALLRVLRDSGDDGEPLVLSCGKNPCHHTNRFTIPCIGLFSEPVLAAMNVAARREFYLDIHGCADCDNGHVLGLLQTRMLGILSKNGSSAELKLRYLTEKNIGMASYRQQRRSFLGMVKSNLAGLGETATPVVRTTNNINHDKSAAAVSLLLQQALAMLPENDTMARKLLLSYQYTLTANDRCDLCPRCTGMCPTGALKRLSNNAGGKKLYFTSAKCSGCGICLAFCNKKALTLQPGAQYPPDTARVIA